MDSIQYEALRKMFNDKRLHPWIPEHEIFIKGELAKLAVTEPKDAASYKAFYDEKMKKYLESQKSVEVPVEQPVEEAPKKRGPKKK